MTERTWVILGATSIIAEHFAHCAAKSQYALQLVGRDLEQLNLIAQDIQLRYQISCSVLHIDLKKPQSILSFLAESPGELDLFIAHSDFTENEHLDSQSITQLVNLNINTTLLCIHTYLNRVQQHYNLLYLSSVAACRGRAKNSLYGASKACIEIYLQGVQQRASPNQNICIARLGFIDTKQTYGLPGIFYAGAPASCAKACWHAVQKNKRLIYYPFFWRGIMAIITALPFFLYKRMPQV